MKKIAEREIDNGTARIENWWSNKYKLPANHLLFRNRSVASLHIEMIKDLLLKKEQVEKDIKTSYGRELSDLMKQLNDINRALNSEEGIISEDPLIDKWEKELEEGKIPNLNEGWMNA